MADCLKLLPTEVSGRREWTIETDAFGKFAVTGWNLRYSRRCCRTERQGGFDDLWGFEIFLHMLLLLLDYQQYRINF